MSAQGETPRNGIKGLKHWRFDLMAGLQVALVSLPLSIGIAVASGAPPVTGIISSIIAGLVFPFLGGAYVTISGPAAGLAPALFAGMLALGGGDLAAGYSLLLVAIFLTGVAQIVMAQMKMGRFAMFSVRSGRAKPPRAWKNCWRLRNGSRGRKRQRANDLRPTLPR